MLLKIIKSLRKWINRLYSKLGIGYVDMHSELGARVIRRDGTEENLGIIARKKVTVEFVDYLVDCMQTSTAGFANFKYHLSGTSTQAESNTNTQLITPIGTARVVGSQGEGDYPNIYKSIATIGYGGNYAVTEHGIFNEQYAAAQDNGVLLDRSVFAAINIENGDSIQWTYLLTVNPET